MNETFEQLLQRLQQATAPADMFGTHSSDEAAIRQRYLKLVRVVHPDHNRGVPEAAEAFRLLRHWYERALQDAGRASPSSVDFTVVSRRATYAAVASKLEGDLCDIYEATDQSGDVLLKVVRQPHNNDLMQAEADTLTRIQRELAGQAVSAHFPTLVEAFKSRDEAGASRQVNVFKYDHRFVTLHDVVREYPRGVDPADAGWMFNRMLAALGAAHSLGIVHGAVILPHILVRTDDHNGMLVDWCYSVENGGTVAAISPPYSPDFAPEIHAKQPASPATDLFMAARSLVRLLGGNGDADSLPSQVPRAMQALLRACLIVAPHRRYQSAWQVFDDWQEVLGRLYGPPTFRPFHMPNTVR